LLALIGPLAFAPAPLPRRERGRQTAGITLEGFQGSWRITKRLTLRANGQHVPSTSPVTHIRVVGDRWTFMTGRGEGNTLLIAIDNTKSPAHLNFYNKGGRKESVYGVGLIRRHGPGVQVLYTWGGEQRRPPGFEPPPEGIWCIFMQKD
jgi:uncharacterized protein (TIGR03067 family)